MQQKAEEAEPPAVTGSITLVVYSDGHAEIQTAGVFENSPTLISDLLDCLTGP